MYFFLSAYSIAYRPILGLLCFSQMKYFWQFCIPANAAFWFKLITIEQQSKK